MSAETINIHTENNDYQRIEVLKRNRKKRQKYRELLVEGVRAINEMVAREWPVRAFVYSSDRALSNWAKAILKKSRAEVHYILPDALMDKLSDKEEASELLAVARMPDDDLSRIPASDTAVVVLFDRPASPGNLGTLIRSCDAMGCGGVMVSGHAADVYDPRTIRAAMGSFFSLPVVRIASHEQVTAWLEEARQSGRVFEVVATSAKAEKGLAHHAFGERTLLLIGNETQGLSAGYRELADVALTIPMGGAATSMNVACAASVCLYEITRQQREGRS